MSRPRAGYYLDGARVPGASSVSKVGQDTQGIIYWANHLGLDAYEMVYATLLGPRPNLAAIQAVVRAHPPEQYDHNRVLEGEGGVGTLAHQLFDAWILTGETPDTLALREHSREQTDRAMRSFDNARRWWDGLKIIRRIATEFPMVSKTYRYGGTPDGLFATASDKIILPDWKTAKAIYREFWCQVAAYGHLVIHGYHAPGGVMGEECFDIDEIAEYHIVRFSKDSGDFVHHSALEVDVAWQAFKVKRELYDLNAKLKKRFP